MSPYVSDACLGPQLWIGEDSPDPSRVDPIADTPHRPTGKPTGGVWTSPLRDDGTSGWVNWMQKQDYTPYENPEAWILTPKDEVDVFRIETQSDTEVLFQGTPPTETYPLDPEYDFESVFQLCDAIYLTKQGVEVISDPLVTSLYGWDCESILWDGWQFTETERISIDAF